MSERWKNAPENSNWGHFGPDDQRGRMNLVDEKKVLQGVAEVKTARAFLYRCRLIFRVVTH